MSRLIFLLFLIGAHSLLLGQELNRRAFLGVQLSSLSDSAAKANNIPKGNGVLILQVFPASSASAADLRKGDIILAVDQAVVRGVAGFLGQIKAYEAGDNANLQIMRTGQKQTLDLVLKPMSGEEYDNASVQYDAVKGPSGLLRTILTLPEGAKNPPVLYIIQGIDCGSIDIAFQPSSSYRRLIDACHEAGIATFRVEKSGVGDSKGTACRDCDFMEDAEGFLAGLKQLKKDKTIDAEQIYLLGISMGGVWAPWMASQKSVAGIIAYGTIGRPLNEYLLENSRRQAILRGTDFVDIEEDRKLDARLYHYLFEERMSPQAVMSEHPDF
ncbi:MAG: PDZ domain-containing protein [Bacteroidota bacterium]